MLYSSLGKGAINSAGQFTRTEVTVALKRHGIVKDGKTRWIHYVFVERL